MKKTSFWVLTLVSVFVSMVVLADDQPIPVSKLPQSVASFVQQYFPQNQMLYAEMDWDNYEVRLDNGTKLDFDKMGNWQKVDCRMMPVPATLVPEAVANYVKTAYAGAVITKIAKKVYGYEAELNNGLELKFNAAGTLLGIDD